MMTDTQQNDGPPFLADLADDAIMTGTILAKPLKGKDVISQVIRSIASCYVSQSMSGHAVDGSIETIEYDAELESGGTIHGSVIVTRRADGKVVNRWPPLSSSGSSGTGNGFENEVGRFVDAGPEAALRVRSVV
jgi:hypothetical protein